MSSKVAIITGSSRGIGAATARLAADAGYAVCVNYLGNRTAAEAVVHEVESAGGRAILWLLSDQASYTTGSFIDVSGGR